MRPLRAPGEQVSGHRLRRSGCGHRPTHARACARPPRRCTSDQQHGTGHGRPKSDAAGQLGGLSQARRRRRCRAHASPARKAAAELSRRARQDARRPRDAVHHRLPRRMPADGRSGHREERGAVPVRHPPGSAALVGARPVPPPPPLHTGRGDHVRPRRHAGPLRGRAHSEAPRPGGPPAPGGRRPGGHAGGVHRHATPGTPPPMAHGQRRPGPERDAGRRGRSSGHGLPRERRRQDPRSRGVCPERRVAGDAGEEGRPAARRGGPGEAAAQRRRDAVPARDLRAAVPLRIGAPRLPLHLRAPRPQVRLAAREGLRGGGACRREPTAPGSGTAGDEGAGRARDGALPATSQALRGRRHQGAAGRAAAPRRGAADVCHGRMR
mmetsp:Transcript_111204/g.346611  ORF Transcript_111204/g.346611 Transcript_111204/m.346611 type:complete len:381 (-) Transcript_111204:317-1459(-)